MSTILAKSTLAQYQKFLESLELSNIIEDETLKKTNNGYSLSNENIHIRVNSNPYSGQESLFEIEITNPDNSHRIDDIIRKNLIIINESQHKRLVNDELNPSLWDKQKAEYNLKNEVNEALDKITEAFVEFLDLSNFTVEDIVLTGSNVNYNWTPDSDLDVHLIVNFDRLRKVHGPLIKGYSDAKRLLWNDLHDIKINGYQVEMYIEDSNEKHVSTGIYSIEKNKWIIVPERVNVKIDTKELSAKVESFTKMIN